MSTTLPHTPGWTVGESIALELDAAMMVVNGFYSTPGLPEELASLLQAVPETWRTEWAALLGDVKNAISPLGDAAGLAGLLQARDYSEVTLALRQMTAETALARLAGAAPEIVPDPTLAPAARLVDALARATVTWYQALGFDIRTDDTRGRRITQDAARLARILPDGDLHARFWHWLDRFYYEAYRPWRDTRREMVQRQIQRAQSVLGAPEQEGRPPDLSWLPPQNPLLRYPELQRAVRQGQVRVFFWVEPFGLADSWTLAPGLLALSFAEPGALYENFRAYAADVAARTQALSDPTRLIILRIIRHFGMINTEIADFLELSRPTVSVHAKILREAGLIESRQVGRQVRHEIVPQEVRRLFRDLERFLDLPDDET